MTIPIRLDEPGNTLATAPSVARNQISYRRVPLVAAASRPENAQFVTSVLDP